MVPLTPNRAVPEQNRKPALYRGVDRRGRRYGKRWYATPTTWSPDNLRHPLKSTAARAINVNENDA